MSRRSETQAGVPKKIQRATPPPKKKDVLYRKPAPRPPVGRDSVEPTNSPALAPQFRGPRPPRAQRDAPRVSADPLHATPIATAQFQLREDGSIASVGQASSLSPSSTSPPSTLDPRPSTAPNLVFSSDSPFVRLYHGNCLELLDAIHARYGDAGRFDCIFADPPYFLSNGGITCHAGKMVKVDKGDWDKSRGPELNHEFNREWLRRCQRVLKPNGTIWVSGTHHVIFSIGYAMQELGYKILNDIAWEKPNPPPNLSCCYFTHSTETILWAAKNEKSKHTFNYAAMKAVTGKQMKTVWTMQAPRNVEKTFGKHPTQKPVALVERCILASTNRGELVLDPFLGGGTTAIAAVRLNRQFIGIELDLTHLSLAQRRADREIIEIWLRHFRVRINITIASTADLPLRHGGARLSRAQTPPSSHFPGGARLRRAQTSFPRHLQIDLDLFPNSINGSPAMSDQPEIQTERIFHETKFVFLSCAEVTSGSVVHTTVDVSLQEAWAKTPTGKKRETTHIVRCETEILRLRNP